MAEARNVALFVLAGDQQTCHTYDLEVALADGYKLQESVEESDSVEVGLVGEVELAVGSREPVEQDGSVLARDLGLALEEVGVHFVLFLGLEQIGVDLLDVRGTGLDIFQVSLIDREHVFRVCRHELFNWVHFLNCEKEWELNE